MPQAAAPTLARKVSMVRMANTNPSPSPPTMSSAGTRQPWNSISPIGCAAIIAVRSTTLKPGILALTKIADMLGSGLADCIGPQALHDERKIGQRRGISKRLANQTKGTHVKLCTRQGNGITQRSGFRQHTDVFTQPSVEVTFFNCTRFD